MSVVDEVRRCKTPTEALLVLAGAIDALRDRLDEITEEDPWDQPLTWDEDPIPGPLVQIEQTGEEETTVTLTTPSDEKYGQRLDFAINVLNLAEALPDLGEQAPDTYAKAGPLWLWLGNRDLLMQYPDHVRRAMVRDVLEDDPQTAAEFGRDVLKDLGFETADSYTARRGM